MKKSKLCAAVLAAVLSVSALSLSSASPAAITVEAKSSSAVPANKKLENKTVRLLSYYDPFNEGSNSSKSESLKYFEKKYGGEVKLYKTTWENRYSDLSQYVLSGEGIDMYLYDSYALPRGIVDGFFQPVDSYVNLKSDLWKNVSTLTDNFKFGGKHYLMATGAEAENVVLYSSSTIKKYGLSDPYTLWTKGKWNWDTFKSMLNKYVNTDKDRYGLDGWYSEKALYTSAGVPTVSLSNGKLKSNLNDKTLAKAMDFEYSLYKKGLVFDKALYDWTTREYFMGDGKELFYIVGAWDVETVPSLWSTHIDPDDLRMAPVPSPKGSKNYMGVSVSGYCIPKGASNPEGAARLAECALYTDFVNPDTKALKKKQKNDYGWNSYVIKQYEAINKAALKNPVIDLVDGSISDDNILNYYVSSESSGYRAALHGIEWSKTKKDCSFINEYIDDMNERIENIIS